MEYKFKIHRDIYKDAWNWWDSCNCICFGVDWSKRIDHDLAISIKGKSQKDAYKFILPYLRNRYQKEDRELKKGYDAIKHELDDKFIPACDILAKVMGRPIYRKSFNFYLTTFPSIPYNKNKGYVWLNYSYKNTIGIFLHELCHMQFIHYWQEDSNSNISKLSNDQFEMLKESLTVILDRDFFPFIDEVDSGYKVHKNFRQKLYCFWQKGKNFDHLVEYGMRILQNKK